MKGSTVDGPMLPYDTRDHPQKVRLLGSVQNKLITLCFTSPDEFTVNKNIVLKQMQLNKSKVFYCAISPVQMTNKQEQELRILLSKATEDNANKQLKHLKVVHARTLRELRHTKMTSKNYLSSKQMYE